MIARRLADQAAEYAAEIERLAAQQQADDAGTPRRDQHWVGRQELAFLPPPVSPLTGLARKRGDQRMRDHVPGEQYAQVDNADPFTAPVWRSPVHRTPEWVIWLVQLVRLLIRVIWFLIRHPLLDAAAGIVVTTWAKAGWPGVVVLANVTVAALVTLRLARPDWYARLVTVPAKSRWRWWCYRRRWQPVMTIAGLAPTYRGRVTVPVLGKVQAGPCADLVTVRLVSGQSPKLFADRARSWRTGSGCCRAGSAPPRPGWWSWNWSAGTPWRRSSRPCPSRLPRICGRCRSAGARTAARSRSGCTEPTCSSPGRRARARAPTSGAWSGRCSRPCWPGSPWCMRVTRS